MLTITHAVALAAVLSSSVLAHCSNERPSARPVAPTFERKKQCAELGWKTYDRMVVETKRMARNDHSTIYGEPHFAADIIENTCYLEYETTIFGKGPEGTAFTVLSGFLYDVLSNRTLASYGVTKYRGGRTESFGEMPEPSYNARRKELMSY